MSPFAIMEILAYSLAMSRSMIIAYYPVRRPRSWEQSWKKYPIPTIIEVAIVVSVPLNWIHSRLAKALTTNIKTEKHLMNF